MSRRLLACDDCGMPVEVTDAAARTACCGACTDERTDRRPALVEAATATEAEVLEAVRYAWTFLANPSVTDYLNRVARQVATHVAGAPAEVRVALFQDSEPKSLGFPSGRILLSIGLLSTVDDEAELAYVLAHELAHVAADHTSPLLVRLALGSVAAHDAGPTGDAWKHAAEDLMVLGYGARREREADRQALCALQSAGYDPASALRFLDRMGAEPGADSIRDYACAHPPALDRRARLEREIQALPSVGFGGRVNREPFRRVAGPGVLASRLERVDGFEQGDTTPVVSSWGRARIAWIALGVVGLTLLFLIVGLLLSR